MSKELYEMKSDHWAEFLKWWCSTYQRGKPVSFEEIIPLLSGEYYEDDPLKLNEVMFNLETLYRTVDMDIVNDDGEVTNADRHSL